MEILKIIISVVYTLFLYYRIGVLTKKVLNSKDESLSTTILYGFIINFAIFEIINIPFIIIEKNTTKIVYAIFIILNIAYIALSYLLKREQKNFNIINTLKNIKIEKNFETLCFIIAIFLIGFQILNSSFLFKQDADDSFYISWANEARNLESMYDKFPDTGIDGSKFDKKYMLNTWEIYGGFSARLLKINTPSLFHTAYPMIYIINAYMAYYTLLKKTCKKENLKFAFLVFSIFMMFSGIGAKTKGLFLLSRIHQGKSILANIILPLSIAEFLEYKNFNKNNYIILSLIYIAAIAVSPITIWFLSIQYGLFIILMFLRKEFKIMKKSLLLLIPIAIACILYLVFVSSEVANLGAITNSESFNWQEDLKKLIEPGKARIVLYFISILIIILKGNKTQKEICLIIPALVCILVINPVLKNIYIKVVTSATYWRLYWLIPLEISVAIATTIIYDMIKKPKYKEIFTIMAGIIIVICGNYVYQETLGFSEFENFEKIPQYIIDEANYIEQKTDGQTRVTAPGEPLHSCTIRQFSTKILLMNSRSRENDVYSEYLDFYTDIYIIEAERYNTETINKLIEICNVDWVILPKTKILEITDNDKFEIRTENEYDYILKAK